jgi:hypothetical protein
MTGRWPRWPRAPRAIAGLSGPWPGELLVGGLFVAAVTVWRGPVAGGVIQAARSPQRNLDMRDAVLVQEQAVRAAAELERSLHGTALNTLETIAAHGNHLDPEPVARPVDRDRCRPQHGNDTDPGGRP